MKSSTNVHSFIRQSHIFCNVCDSCSNTRSVCDVNQIAVGADFNACLHFLCSLWQTFHLGQFLSQTSEWPVRSAGVLRWGLRYQYKRYPTSEHRGISSDIVCCNIYTKFMSHDECHWSPSHLKDTTVSLKGSMNHLKAGPVWWSDNGHIEKTPAG